MNRYTENDLIKDGGKISTVDGFYRLRHDGDYSYWCNSEGRVMGHYSYDYCFRSNLQNCAGVLNRVVNRYKSIEVMEA